MVTDLTKEDWLTFLGCSTRAWLQLRRGLPRPSEAELFRLQQGREVHAQARSLFPEGVMVCPEDEEDAEEVTTRLIASGAKTLFEAKAVAGSFVAKADVITRIRKGWHLFEVKSRLSRHPTSLTSDLVDDLGYTVMVFQEAGFKIAKVTLLSLSPDFQCGGRTADLFVREDVTSDVLLQADLFSMSAGLKLSLLSRKEMPVPSLIADCKRCPFFRSDCFAENQAATILDLPFLNRHKLDQLSFDGVIELNSVPKDFPLSARQRMISDCQSARRPHVNAVGLQKSLSTISWPCHYLDFEGMQLFLPVYDSHRCHQQVLVQFSTYVRESATSSLRHISYMANPLQDSEEEFAVKLIAAVGNVGTIFVYGNHELKSIKRLGESFPQLRTQLEGIRGRLLDLFPVMSRNVYFPEFLGELKLKRVAESLFGKASDVQDAISDGQAAMTWFGRLARKELSREDEQIVKERLQAYCARDARHLVSLHDLLTGLATAETAIPKKKPVQSRKTALRRCSNAS